MTRRQPDREIVSAAEGPSSRRPSRAAPPRDSERGSRGDGVREAAPSPPPGASSRRESAPARLAIVSACGRSASDGVGDGALDDRRVEDIIAELRQDQRRRPRASATRVRSRRPMRPCCDSPCRRRTAYARCPTRRAVPHQARAARARRESREQVLGFERRAPAGQTACRQLTEGRRRALP